VTTILDACYNSTTSISVKASTSWPLAISGRAWVDYAGRALSPGRGSSWLSLLGDILTVFFSSLRHSGR
jgi:hypothetical protein